MSISAVQSIDIGIPIIRVPLLDFRGFKCKHSYAYLHDTCSLMSIYREYGKKDFAYLNEHVEEVIHYIQFGSCWVALGVASPIGLGARLHTFVLYLGPHIALFTIKAMQCGRVDIESAPYDTIQLKRGPFMALKNKSSTILGDSDHSPR